MRYIFFLGRNPALSLAELQAMLEKYKLSYSAPVVSPAFAILDIEGEFSLRDFFVQMGGTVKIAEFLGSFPAEDIRGALVDVVRQALADKPTKKNIGYSVYSTSKEEKDKAAQRAAFYQDIFSKMKRDELKDSSIRVVYPEAGESELSTATVFNNRLTRPGKGIEFDLIHQGGKVLLGRTLIVQDIESYSMRDYEKPGRDAKIGMMPPKLAQAMLNLAQPRVGQTVFDPFCGTGTILVEALLNDYRAIGSDANDEQVAKCKQNLDWIASKYVLTYPDYKVFQADFAEAFRRLKPDSVDAVVTESTLGPVYKKVPNPTEIKSNYAALRKLTERLLQTAQPVLRRGGRLVLTLPAYQLKPKEFVFGEFVDSLEKLGYSIVCPLPTRFEGGDIRITRRNTIIYSRPEQIVAREIIVFKNNKQ